MTRVSVDRLPFHLLSTCRNLVVNDLDLQGQGSVQRIPQEPLEQQIPLCLQFFAFLHGIEWSRLHMD
jgi:hypothetical protein